MRICDATAARPRRRGAVPGARAGSRAAMVLRSSRNTPQARRAGALLSRRRCVTAHGLSTGDETDDRDQPVGVGEQDEVFAARLTDLAADRLVALLRGRGVAIA